jgi:Leucine-rich repeat (LRR) protein
MLEELVLSENNIEDIPVSLSLMSNLKVIKLANNRLKTIPYEIADILTLEEIDCSNNHHLESIPAKWRGDTDSVLFTCRVHRGRRRESGPGVSGI